MIAKNVFHFDFRSQYKTNSTCTFFIHKFFLLKAQNSDFRLKFSDLKSQKVEFSKLKRLKCKLLFVKTAKWFDIVYSLFAGKKIRTFFETKLLKSLNIVTSPFKKLSKKNAVHFKNEMATYFWSSKLIHRPAVTKDYSGSQKLEGFYSEK